MLQDSSSDTLETCDFARDPRSPAETCNRMAARLIPVHPNSLPHKLSNDTFECVPRYVRGSLIKDTHKFAHMSNKN